MKKTNALWIALDSVFLIVFNAVFFVAGGVDHKVSVWITYGFIHFAYLMLLLTPVLTRKGKSAAVFGFSLYTISTMYFIVELVIGIIFILISLNSYKAVLLTQVIIAGLYAIMLISNMIANEHTADAEEERQYSIAYVKNASARIKSLLSVIEDKETKKKVEKLYDTIYSSPVKSHPNLAQMESRILQSVDELADAVSAGDKDSIISLANTLISAVNERNVRLKTLN